MYYTELKKRVEINMFVQKNKQMSLSEEVANTPHVSNTCEVFAFPYIFGSKGKGKAVP
jgi:hypothetical protein